MPRAQTPRYRLFSWEHSYFSGKVRACLRYKAALGELSFEDVLATPELILGLLIPATGSNVVPQLQRPDGRIVQDSSEILDTLEREHPEPRVFPPASSPRQRVAAFLIELLADEWMVVYAFWARWRHARESDVPSHAAFNEQQWGAVLAPGAEGLARRRAGRLFFEQAFGIHEPQAPPRGVFAGLVALGVNERTAPAWEASNARLLAALEAHFAAHDYVLGGLPSLADFALLGPLYAHLFRDAAPGFVLRTRYPLVAEWVERTHHTGDLNARSYAQRLYSLGPDRELVGRPATSDGGAWLADDALAPTLAPVLAVFFDEMWPVLVSSIEKLRAWLASEPATPEREIPGKTFTASPGFEAAQTGDGPLTHTFTLGGVSARRMVVPYQVWMLQRLAAVLRECRAQPRERAALDAWLASFARGPELLALERLLTGIRIEKRGGRLFEAAARPPEAA